MLPTIKLDDQMCRQAHEVHDVSSQRVLSPKFAPCQLLATQEIPQATFGIGRCISQYSSTRPFALHGESFARMCGCG
jgi:hypothetical protein